MKAKADLLNDPIVPTLKNMTIPMIYGMILLMSFGLVDTFFVSLLGTDPLAAISFTFPVTFTVISLIIGLGIGTSAVIGKTMGSGEQQLAKTHGSSALIMAALLVGICVVTVYLSIEPIFKALGAQEHHLPLIKDYMGIWCLAGMFLALPMVGNSVLRASGDTKTPSMIMAAGGAINAILDPFLIFGIGPFPELGIKGAAIATMVAWLVGTVMIYYLLAYKRELIDKGFPSLETLMSSSRQVLKIGLPAAGANMLTPLANGIMTSIVAAYGAAAVAAWGVGSRIESLASLVVLALSMTLPPFVSQNFGAGNIERIEQAYRSTIRFIIFWQLGIYVLLLGTGWLIASAFAQDAEVESLIILFLWIVPLGYGLQGITILTNSSFNALHKPMNALILSVVRLFVCFVPVCYVASHLFGLKGLFVGTIVANMMTALFAYRWFKQHLVRIMPIASEPEPSA